jgi:hypothetical protein
MKFGLLCYNFKFKKSTNVGDYIQSLAAKRFIDEIKAESILINREELSIWDGEKLPLFMNGWFMHNPDNWPPNDNIIPIFVSFHINDSVKDVFSRPVSINYFEQFQPIGCRDLSTVQFLNEKGIKSYFTGCLTLTLEKSKYSNKKSEENIDVLFCDILHLKGSVRYLFKRRDITFFSKCLRFPRIIKEKLGGKNSSKIMHKLKGALGKRKVDYLTTQLSNKLSEKVRFEIAAVYLKKYAHAKLVVTSRIHVALPCLAFGTPVLFVNPELDESRFPGLLELLNVIEPKDLLSMKKNDLKQMLLNLKNKNNYLIKRDELINYCSTIVNKISRDNELNKL